MTIYRDEQGRFAPAPDEDDDEPPYVNEECPDECGIEHDVDEECILVCPDTGNRWRYCSECGWERNRYIYSGPTYINGRLLCDPADHGYESCYDCGEWVDQAEIRYSERHDAYYCDGCYRSGSGHTGSCGQSTQYCRECSTHDLNLHLITEDFLCDHLAIEAHLRGEAVQFADDSVPVRFLRRLAA